MFPLRSASLGLTYPFLAFMGFDPKEGAVNTPQAIHYLELIFVLGPIFFVMLGGACVIGWRLDAQRHSAVRAELVPSREWLELGWRSLRGAEPN